MTRLVIGLILLAGGVVPASAQEQPAVPSEIVRSVRVTGAKELTEQDCLSAARVRPGEPLPGTPEEIASAVERRYRDGGYSFARASAAWDGDAGALSIVVDEGVINSVEFRGVNETVAHRLAEDFALKAGDVFNRARSIEALRALLRPTRGAITPRRDPFDISDAGGRRTLLVVVREPAGRFRVVPDLGDREDWFTPVDGFVPSLGFGAAVFDHAAFNHAFVSGHISFKTASDTVGYALGFEKPFFGARKLFVGGELHDLTATDDDWRVTSFEASLSAMAVRRSFRDYYRRRGVQLTAAFRPDSRGELFAVFRSQREEPLAAITDFSLWRGDEPLRPNVAATGGRLQSLILGGSLDGQGFDRESLESTYRRHQLDTAFGKRLPGVNDARTQWRVDAQSEISTPGALGSDFDFTRTIVAARYRTRLSPHQAFGARAIAGWSTGVLPPQRIFGVGGLGSVEGYAFKAQTGTAMTLVNLEYALGWREGLRVFGLYDIGRATTAAADPPWMKGVGVGLGIGDGFRIDFGYRVDAVPSSLQVLLRFGRTF